MASCVGEISGQITTGVSIPPRERHIRATARRQTTTPSFAMDLRFLRQVILRGEALRHAFRPPTQEPD